MRELHAIHDGSVLIHNGVIEEAGPSRRVENLGPARKAREIDASRRIVMPAFVDPDGVLVFPAMPTRADPAGGESRLRVLSRRLVLSGAVDLAADRARCGTLTMAAHTAHAKDLKETVKVLTVHRSLQNKPLRIRSILSPSLHSAEEIEAFDLKLLPAIKKRKLASIVEFTSGAALDAAQIRAAAVAASNHSFWIRFRCVGPAEPELLALAKEAGAVAIIGSPRVAETGAVWVLSAAEAMSWREDHTTAVRRAMDAGIPVAIGSGYDKTGERSSNSQYLLHVGMHSFGLSCEEAIMASTYNAACALRMGQVTGSLEPGKAADLLIVDVPDYRDLARRVGHNDVLLTMRAGVPVYRRAPVTGPPD